MYMYLPIALTSANYILVVGLGLAVGLLSGLFGVGRAEEFLTNLLERFFAIVRYNNLEPGEFQEGIQGCNDRFIVINQ